MKIENQFEKTNHDHLGIIITYRSGYKARHIVWIIEKLEEEARNAIEWLSDHTDEYINFYLVRLEIYQIREIQVFVNFTLLSGPKKWSNNLRKLAENDLNGLYLEFWKGFKIYCDLKGTQLYFGKPQPQLYNSMTFEDTRAKISLSISKRDKIMRCNFWIQNSVEFYMALYTLKAEIESKINEKLIWEGPSNIYLQTEMDLFSKDNWNKYFDWLLIKAELFENVFLGYKNLGAEI